jgi:hypothetical protein
VLALAERDPDSLDSYRGPSAWRAEAQARRATLEEIGQSVHNLSESLSRESGQDDDGGERRAFLLRQLRAIAARVEILKGARPRFDEEATELFGIEWGTLGSQGSQGSLGSVGSVRESVIPPDRVPAVLARAVAGCRAATLAHLPLPPSEQVSVEFVPDYSWSAFTHYEGRFRSRIRVNARLPLTVDGALDLACHEAYPGHHTVNVVIESRFGDTRPEFFVQPLFSPQSLLHEGAAMVASSFAFSDADRVAFERDQLFPLAGLDPSKAARSVEASRARERLKWTQVEILRRYIDGELDFARASMALARQVPGESADEMLKFANQFRTYVVTYPVGQKLVTDYLDQHSSAAEDEAGRWRTYMELVTGPAQNLPQGSSRR